MTRTGPTSNLVLLPLGGMGEIGMNMYLYGFGTGHARKWIMVDCGVKFGEEAEPGIDVVLPDTRFIESEGRNLLGILLTHAHEDHHGAVVWLWSRLRRPVYCTPFAAEMLKIKLGEAGLLKESIIHVVPEGGHVSLGPFEVDFIPVTHSIPEPNALLIRTPVGNVLHSGDWKIDTHPSIPPLMDEKALKAAGEEGVRALVCDSTNVLRTGSSPSEKDVGENLRRLIAQAPGRVVVTTFASHVGRLTSVAMAARAAGREIVIAGRAMRNVSEAARTVGLLGSAGQFLDEDAFGYLPPERTLLLCTGSQGEPRAAIARIAEGSHPSIELDAGDTVIFSSRTIPGNEHAVGSVINNLAAKGIRVITSDDELVHTSGHPRQDELRQFYGWVKPELLVPMHGEARHLHAHAAFAKACGIRESIVIGNGDMLRLAPGPAEVIDEAPAGRLHVDGRLIVPSVEGPAKYRRRLSFAGVVFVTVALDDNGGVVAGPRVICEGLPAETEDGETFETILLEAVDDALDKLPRAKRRADDPVAEALRVAVRRAAEAEWGKKPICHVAVQRV